VAIHSVSDGNGLNFIVDENDIAHIVNDTYDEKLINGFYYPFFQPTPCFSIYKKDNSLWKRVYFPTAIVTYDGKNTP